LPRQKTLVSRSVRYRKARFAGQLWLLGKDFQRNIRGRSGVDIEANHQRRAFQQQDGL
jgi:hypothetical protein